jgi:hypothetical protein
VLVGWTLFEGFSPLKRKFQFGRKLLTHKKYMIKLINSSVRQGFTALLIVAVLFLLAEPAISLSATTATSQFTISQTITSEVSFSTPASNVILSPSLGGITGGTSDGGTQVIVQTNDHLGYTMTLTASSSLGMIGNASSTNYIPAYATSSSFAADYNFNVPTNRAYFGYTVEASTTSDLPALFKDNNAGACGTGSNDTANACWVGATSTPLTIINRNYQTPASGATTTLKFRVKIMPNPSPVIPDDTYVATTTLTATVN